jgi:hypothetical protein
MKLDQEDIDVIAQETVRLLQFELRKLLVVAAVGYLVIECIFHRWLGWI